MSRNPLSWLSTGLRRIGGHIFLFLVAIFMCINPDLKEYAKRPSSSSTDPVLEAGTQVITPKIRLTTPEGSMYEIKDFPEEPEGSLM